MWNCKNCKEQNEDSFDICWKCGYGMDGETPDEIESEVEIIQKDTKERIKAEDEKYRKKKRWIIFLIFLPFIMGFINHFIQKESGLSAYLPMIKKIKYDIQDTNESKSIIINWSGKKDSCLWLGFQNPDSDFTDYIIRGKYKLEIFSDDNILLKSVNIYHNKNSDPSTADTYEDRLRTDLSTVY